MEHLAVDTPPRTSYRTIPALVAFIMLLGPVSWTDGLDSAPVPQSTSAPRARRFSGSSESLSRTVIVPTLDSPSPRGKNVIWCSSFQLVWNEWKENVIKAPIQIAGAETVAARLNAAGQSRTDLDPNSVYAAGGWIGDGIIGRIQKDMAAKFPSHPLPDFSRYTDGILAYSYLTANVPFTHPFRRVEGFAFVDSHGAKTQIEGFGLWQAYAPQYAKIKDQVEVFYYRESKWQREAQECAIDLCKFSRPYQVVLAIVEPNDSLAQMLAHVRRRTDESRGRSYYQNQSKFHKIDFLQVPEMFWRIDHRFRELIGKFITNAGSAMPIVEALQTIEFRLDRSGAAVESESLVTASAIPRFLVFDRPFLVYMQRRDADWPFFVMWVDNAELLMPK